MGRDYGNPGDYDTRFPGLNARMSEFHAAMALESLEMLDDALEHRRRLAAAYRDLLADVDGIRCQAIPDDDTSTYKDFTVVVEADFGLKRDDLARALAAAGIEPRNYSDPPVHRQQAYVDTAPRELPVTETLSESVVSLPIYHELDEEHVATVVDTIANAREHAAAIV